MVPASNLKPWLHAACTNSKQSPSLCTQCALLANSAGVGGGPFYVPLLNVVVGFSLQECTGLSHTIVATSAIASTLYGLTHPRPNHPDRPLVDLDVALIFIPALLFGVSLGQSPCQNVIATDSHCTSMLIAEMYEHQCIEQAVTAPDALYSSSHNGWAHAESCRLGSYRLEISSVFQ